MPVDTHVWLHNVILGWARNLVVVSKMAHLQVPGSSMYLSDCFICP